MPNPTMKLIASVTVGAGGAASIDFTSIPGTYTDLKLVVSARSSSTAGQPWAVIRATFNGSSSNWAYKAIYGDGSTASSAGNTLSELGFGTSSSNTASTFGNTEIYIPNYANSSYKSVSVDSVTENNATQTLSALEANLWSNTAAITSISLPCATGTWVQNSTAYLYGISNS